MIQDQTEQHDAAIASYDEALARNPRDADTWNDRGNALATLGQYTAAIASDDRAIHLNSDHPFAHRHRAVTLDNLGQYAEAETSYRHAIALGPHPSSVGAAKSIAIADKGTSIPS